jgi:hypothetical protein
MPAKNSSALKGRRWAWAALFVTVAAVLMMVLVPVWVVQPFKGQTERGLALSYALRRWSPLATLIAAALSLALVLWLWCDAGRWWRRTLLLIMLVPVFAATWFARQNHFEWMFNPLRAAAYAKASEAGFVADTDMVMSVENGGDAVAYPVRQMAYHHVVQDVVGGKPVVATY